MIDPQLNGKVALITGANHGIGAATARALAAQGVRVFLSYYQLEPTTTADERQQALDTAQGGLALYEASQAQPASVVVEQICAVGGTAMAMAADLGDADAPARLYDACESALGPVDILVINHTHDVLETFDPARVTASRQSADESGEGIEQRMDHSNAGFQRVLTHAASIDRHMAVNVRGTALLIKEHAVRHIARGANWGRIIALSTDAAHCHPENISYAASKHAIESYTRSAAAELGRYGITVNAVAPGPIQTGYITPEAVDEIATGTPLGRVGEPQDVADAIVFLASEQGRWLTGQLLYVGGGWRMSQ